MIEPCCKFTPPENVLVPVNDNSPTPVFVSEPLPKTAAVIANPTGDAPETSTTRPAVPISNAPESVGVKLGVSLMLTSDAVPPRASVPVNAKDPAVAVVIGLLSVMVPPSAETAVIRVPGITPVPLTNWPMVKL